MDAQWVGKHRAPYHNCLLLIKTFPVEKSLIQRKAAMPNVRWQKFPGRGLRLPWHNARSLKTGIALWRTVRFTDTVHYSCYGMGQHMAAISSNSTDSGCSFISLATSSFLPRCMECRRGLAMRILSVCLSVRVSICQTRDPWQNGRKIGPDFYITWKII